LILRLKCGTILRAASAIDYLKEAAASYLFGFDAACIALCRATLERLL
jgi:hypothetical protein